MSAGAAFSVAELGSAGLDSTGLSWAEPDPVVAGSVEVGVAGLAATGVGAGVVAAGTTAPANRVLGAARTSVAGAPEYSLMYHPMPMAPAHAQISHPSVIHARARERFPVLPPG